MMLKSDIRAFVEAAEKHADRQHRYKTYALLRKILLGFIVISLINILFSYFFYTPTMYRINSENHELVLKYDILQNRVRAQQSRLDEIRMRDNNVYRSLFSLDENDTIGAPSIPDRFCNWKDEEYSHLIGATWQRLDRFALELYTASCSLDELQILAKNKENLSLAIPAIWPVDRTKLKAFYAFGIRKDHPILHRRTMHEGVDMSCNKGTPVYATGDARVEMVDQGQSRSGYGIQVLLDHDFGYKTRYAHLNKAFVARGDKVYRGQLIGEVGSTGGSTGAHLHYEVRYHGRAVNPVNYFNMNMTSDEYRTLMENMQYSDLGTEE